MFRQYDIVATSFLRNRTLSVDWLRNIHTPVPTAVAGGGGTDAKARDRPVDTPGGDGRREHVGGRKVASGESAVGRDSDRAAG
jgi:hypothetical protein